VNLGAMFQDPRALGLIIAALILSGSVCGVALLLRGPLGRGAEAFERLAQEKEVHHSTIEDHQAQLVADTRDAVQRMVADANERMLTALADLHRTLVDQLDEPPKEPARPQRAVPSNPITDTGLLNRTLLDNRVGWEAREPGGRYALLPFDIGDASPSDIAHNPDLQQRVAQWMIKRKAELGGADKHLWEQHYSGAASWYMFLRGELITRCGYGLFVEIEKQLPSWVVNNPEYQEWKAEQRRLRQEPQR